MARKVNQIIRRGTRIGLARASNGRDPETKMRKHLGMRKLISTKCSMTETAGESSIRRCKRSCNDGRRTALAISSRYAAYRSCSLRRARPSPSLAITFRDR
jgi:hypothetical protein